MIPRPLLIAAAAVGLVAALVRGGEARVPLGIAAGLVAVREYAR